MYFARPPYALQKLVGKAIWRLNRHEKKVYLTFDDGPVPEVTPWVLDVLKQYNIYATFFCVGNNIQKHPEIFNKIVANGHAVGNHTHNHINGWNTHTPSYIKNTLMCSEHIQSNLFRPPYGRIKNSQLRILATRYKIIMWDVLSCDFDLNVSPEKCLDISRRYTRNGSIVVFHDSIKAWKNLSFALPAYIESCLKAGYEFEKIVIA